MVYRPTERDLIDMAIHHFRIDDVWETSMDFHSIFDFPACLGPVKAFKSHHIPGCGGPDPEGDGASWCRFA